MTSPCYLLQGCLRIVPQVLEGAQKVISSLASILICHSIPRYPDLLRAKIHELRYQHYLASERLPGFERETLHISARVTLSDCEFAWCL
jgi:hypothetical protein